MPAVGAPTADLTESLVCALVSRQAAPAREAKADEAVAAGMTAALAAASRPLAQKGLQKTLSPQGKMFPLRLCNSRSFFSQDLDFIYFQTH